MWAPDEVVAQHRRRARMLWTALHVAILTYTAWLLYKAVERTKSPNTSVVLSNEVYKYPDLWVCPYNQYGCDDTSLEMGCVNSAWETEAGVPNAIFYPSDGTDQIATDQLQIEANAIDTGTEGRGLCVEFKTSAATAFVGQERDPDEYLDYILLDQHRGWGATHKQDVAYLDCCSAHGINTSPARPHEPTVAPYPTRRSGGLLIRPSGCAETSSLLRMWKVSRAASISPLLFEPLWHRCDRVTRQTRGTSFRGLDQMYWYPSGNETTESTTCVADGEAWVPHREWAYAFLADPDDPSMVSTAVQLSYSCITSASTSHVFNSVGIGLTNQIKYAADDVSSYKAVSTNIGVFKDNVDADIAKPYARLSMEIKQQFDSWEIITELDPFEFAEILGNIGGFRDLILIFWPLFFVATSRPDPHLKPRNCSKSVARTVERASGITKTVATAGPMRRAGSVEMRNESSGATLEDGFQEEPTPWEQPPALGLQRSVSRRVGNSFRVLQPDV